MRALRVHCMRALPVQVTGRLKLREGSHCAYSLRQQYSKLLLQYELHMHKTKGADHGAAPAGSLVKAEPAHAPPAGSGQGGGRVGAGSASEVLHTSTN